MLICSSSAQSGKFFQLYFVPVNAWVGGVSCVASVICEGDTNLETKFENLTGLVTVYE